MANIESKEEILKKFKLSDEEHNETFRRIKNMYIAGKKPVKNPIAVILGGQTGSGKSSMIGYSASMFEDGNVVIINSDEIKPFHPKNVEIAREYPNYYTEITDQDSNTWTSQLFEELRREGYNIIFEGTMKNNRIADDSIKEMLGLGYTVIVRGLATSEIESRLSIVERYIGEIENKGYGRLVLPSHHDATFAGMPNTMEYIENSGLYSILEVYVRGDRNQPKCIYSVGNKDYEERTIEALEGFNYHLNVDSSYKSAKDAVLRGREINDRETKEAVYTGESVEERIKEIEKYKSFPNIAEHIDDLNNLFYGGKSKKQED